MLGGHRWQLIAILKAHNFSSTIQTAFIERVNLTIRQGLAALTRRTSSLAQSKQHLLLHAEWWRAYYHLARPHESLQLKVPGLKRRFRSRSPAMAACITDHLWSVGDILRTPLPSPAVAHS